MKDPIFYNKDLSLSMYSLNCGYIYYYFNKEKNIVLKLWKESCFHVLCFDHDKVNQLYWKSFDTLTEAKKFFYKELKENFNLSKRQAILKSCYKDK